METALKTPLHSHLPQSVVLSLCVIRIINSIFIFGGTLVLWRFDVLYFDPAPILWGVIPLYVFFNIALCFFLQKQFRVPLLYIQLLIDGITITTYIYFSGGIHSEYVFFIFWWCCRQS